MKTRHNIPKFLRGYFRCDLCDELFKRGEGGSLPNYCYEHKKAKKTVELALEEAKKNLANDGEVLLIPR